MPREILPENIKPIDYAVFLEPDLETLQFKGSVDISLQVLETTNQIKLNAVDLELGNVYVTSSDGIEGTDVPFTQMQDKNKQTVTFVFGREFEAGKDCLLSIEFAGKITDNYCGLYRSINLDDKGEHQVVATTFMCPTECRRMFPCFDEPALKAAYKFTVKVASHLTCLANTSVESTEMLGDSEKKLVIFKQTPKMSSYIVALAIGEFCYAESNLFRVPVRVYCSSGLESKCKYAADLGAKTLEFFESKFGINYPLDKCDMLALQDSVVSAMENWGLITFRASAVLYDEATDNAATKQLVSEVVQHELAHQWFGNLVTMEWWDGIWLNEGFATWMSWFACDHFYPEWKFWEQYVGSNLQRCLKMDSLASSHPIQVQVNRASEINQIFDAISYAKGASVLTMIAKDIGEEIFVSGVAKYLKKYQFGNTKTENLWEALSEESGKDVASIMDIWTKQVGYPLLTVTENGKDSITVSQSRFLADGVTDTNGPLYPVNLAIKSLSDGGVNNIQLSERQTTVECDNLCVQGYKLNAESIGIYRVAYPESRVKMLIEDKNEALSVKDKMGLLSDATALAKAGVQSATVLLDMIQAWAPHTRNANIWKQIFDSLQEVSTTFAYYNSGSIATKLREVKLKIVAPLCHELGWEFSPSDSIDETRLKSMLFSGSIGCQDEKTVTAALEIYNTGKIDPNIRAAVYSAVATHAADGSKFIDDMLAIYKQPESSMQALDALRAMGKRADQQDKVLGLILSTEEASIRATDCVDLLTGVGQTTAGTEKLWTWMTSNWSAIETQLPATLNLLSNLVGRCTSGGENNECIGFASKEQLDKVEKFFSDKNTERYDMAVHNALNVIRSRIRWVENDAAELDSYLSQV